jgi:hypothetical protein
MRKNRHVHGLDKCGKKPPSTADRLALDVGQACHKFLKKRGLIVPIKELQYGRKSS